MKMIPQYQCLRAGARSRAFLEGAGARGSMKMYREPEPVKIPKNGSKELGARPF